MPSSCFRRVFPPVGGAVARNYSLWNRGTERGLLLPCRRNYIVRYTSRHRSYNNNGGNHFIQSHHHHPSQKRMLKTSPRRLSSNYNHHHHHPFPNANQLPPPHNQQIINNGGGTNMSDFEFYRIFFTRLAMACGFIHVTSEYIFQITQCDGPSMLPTIYPKGEIILVDRLTPRLFGMDTSCKGDERIRTAQEKQKAHMARLKQQQQQQKTRRRNAKNTASTDTMEETWHERFVPVNELPKQGFWKRFYRNITTGVSVGDVVVLKHPQRDGQVCKRVLGLPGDEVIQPRKAYVQGAARGTGPLNKNLVVVPDGHIWVEGDNTMNSSDSRNYGAVPAALIVGRALIRLWPFRGNAILERGGRPKPQPGQLYAGSVVLPAGYQGESILLKSEEEEQQDG